MSSIKVYDIYILKLLFFFILPFDTPAFSFDVKTITEAKIKIPIFIIFCGISPIRENISPLKPNSSIKNVFVKPNKNPLKVTAPIQ